MQVIGIMGVSVLTNVFLIILKLMGGIFGNSIALVADGVHSFSDLINDFFAMIGGVFSRKPPDQKHPFGHYNIEYITSFGISLVIFGIGFSIIKNSFSSALTIPSWVVIVISCITIFLKFLLSRFILSNGYELNNQILIASGKESSTDVISSSVVLVAAFLMQISIHLPFLQFADKIAAIVVGIFILKIGFDIFRANLSYIIGEQETDIDYIKGVYDVVFSVDGVLAIENFVLLKYGGYYKLTGTLRMNEKITLQEAHLIVDEVERLLTSFDYRIYYITFHMEPYE